MMCLGASFRPTSRLPALRQLRVPLIPDIRGEPRRHRRRPAAPPHRDSTADEIALAREAFESFDIVGLDR